MKRTFLSFTVIMLSLTSCTAQYDELPNNNQQTIIENLTPQTFPVIDGSDSTTPLRKILMCKLLGYDYEWVISPFIQNPDEAPHLLIPQYDCTSEERSHLANNCLLESNTHQSFVNLIDGSVELILTARSISRDEKVYADEKGCTLIEKPIAKDALTFMVNNSNPINSLTIEQIQAIYTGDITNWSEVGGPDMEITPYLRNRNSGSEEKFETMVMDGLTIKELPVMQIGTTMMSPYYLLEQDESGICFTPFYYYSVIVNNGTTRAIGVNGIDMTKENIMNGSYPYISDVYAAVRSDIDKSSIAYKMFQMLTEDFGQSIVEESGYIPLSKSANGIRKIMSEDCKVEYSDNCLIVKSSQSAESVEITDIEGRDIFKSKMESNKVYTPVLSKSIYVVNIRFRHGGQVSQKLLIR